MVSLSKRGAIMRKFKVGDVVQLNSGGPRMTVTQELTGKDRITYYCAWFHENENKISTFPGDALKTASDDLPAPMPEPEN
jgi:uncharacterized protein YodC (DUF2158 family)